MKKKHLFGKQNYIPYIPYIPSHPFVVPRPQQIKRNFFQQLKNEDIGGDEDAGPTCRTYVFQNESHTLGNTLKCIINRYEDVEFCGYTVPHPAESKMHFRIQSHETPALEVLKRGLKDLEKVCDHTINVFEKEVQEYCKT